MEKIIKKYTTLDNNFFMHYTLTYANDEINETKPEIHNKYETFYLIKGNITYFIEGEKVLVNPGDLLLINIGKIHYQLINLSNDYERIVVSFNKNILPFYFDNDSQIFTLFKSNSTNYVLIPKITSDKFNIKETMMNFVSENLNTKYINHILFAELLLYLVKLNNIFDDISINKIPILYSTNHKKNDVINKIIDFINNNLSNNLSLESIANKFYISKYHLSHIFKESIGVPINKYISIKRIYYAYELIKSGMSAQEASIKVGYNYYSSFYYNYKKILNYEPNQIIKKNKKI